MANKNLPNIPIYIGDWERDCNVLSLQAEMAWMKIIFKMHLAGKQSNYKVSAKGLQRLWKSDANEVKEIMQELLFEDICEISEIPGGFIFTCRRLKKENEISEVRSKVAKDRWNKEKKDAKPKQKKSKRVQNTDNDIDNDYDNEDVIKNENENEIKTREEIVLPFETETFKTQWQHWKIYKKKEFKFHYKSIQSEQAALNKLSNISEGNEKTAIKIIHEAMGNGWKGFFELKNDNNGKRANKTNRELASNAMESEIGRNYRTQ